MAPLRSLGNNRSAFDDFYARTGKDAVTPAPVVVGASGAFAAWGGGGGGGEEGCYGGGGGCAVGTLTLPPGNYTFVVGSAGADHDDTAAGFGGAPSSCHNGGGGGGYSGIFAGDLTPYSFKGFDPGGSEDPSANRDTAHAAAIMLAGGGGAAAQEPSANVGGGGGGGTEGDPGDGAPPAPGLGGGGTQSAGGAGGTGGVKNGEDGGKLIGGWGILVPSPPGPLGNGGGGGGYWGGGSGGADSGNFLEAAGGGSGYISSPYGSATLTTGTPGLGTPNGDAALPGSPYYPGTAGQGGAGDPNTGVTGGAFIIGAYTGPGSIAVTPPGGSPTPVPSSGQAFNTAGKYLLVVS